MVEEAAAFGTYVMAHAYAPDSIQRAVAAGVRTIEHGNLIDARTADLIAAKAYVVPTLAVYDGYLEHSKDLGLTADTRDAVEALLDAGLRSLDICRRAGVKIGFGTDLEGMLHGGQLRELTLRAQVMTSAEVIASATITNAEILRAEDKLGVLKAGSSADLLVVNGDPFEDISVLADDTSESVSVMQTGRFVRNPLQPTESHREGAHR
jgi:imidazolonepropionase-like amidohydrolase